MELLRRYYQGQLTPLDADEDDGAGAAEGDEGNIVSDDGDAAGGGGATRGGDGGDGQLLLTEVVQPRSGLPPLLINLSERCGARCALSCKPVLYSALLARHTHTHLHGTHTHTHTHTQMVLRITANCAPPRPLPYDCLCAQQAASLTLPWCIIWTDSTTAQLLVPGWLCAAVSAPERE